MKPFTHKTFVGDFFDVLRAAAPAARPGITVSHGGTRDGEAVISAISGFFDIPQLPDLTASLDALLTARVKLIVLDLARVRFFSHNAAGVLVNFASSVEGRGKRLVLYRPSLTVQQTLGALALLHLFEIQQTEEELLLDLPEQSL